MFLRIAAPLPNSGQLLSKALAQPVQFCQQLQRLLKGDPGWRRGSQMLLVEGSGKIIYLKSFQSGIFIVKYFNFQQYSEVGLRRILHSFQTQYCMEPSALALLTETHMANGMAGSLAAGTNVPF